jgi:hypothetical protein
VAHLTAALQAMGIPSLIPHGVRCCCPLAIG